MTLHPDLGCQDLRLIFLNQFAACFCAFCDTKSMLLSCKYYVVVECSTALLQQVQRNRDLIINHGSNFSST